MFSYCENNPVNNIDKFGKATISIFADLNATLIFGASIGIGISLDTHGGIAVQWYYSRSFDGETGTLGVADVGASVQLQVSGYDSVDDLNGISSSTGISAGSGAYVGVDVFTNKSVADTVRDTKNENGGFKFYAGYGAGVDVHVQQTKTITLFKTSFKDIWHGVINLLRR